jgi:hypothetical protein
LLWVVCIRIYRNSNWFYFSIDKFWWIEDFIPRSSKTLWKRNDELYALVLPFNNFKIGIPALSKGMYNFNLLSRITRHVRHVRDFNELPPFYASLLI